MKEGLGLVVDIPSGCVAKIYTVTVTMTVTWDRFVCMRWCKCALLPASEPSREDAVQNQCNSENHGSNDRDSTKPANTHAQTRDRDRGRDCDRDSVTQ